MHLQYQQNNAYGGHDTYTEAIAQALAYNLKGT